MDMTDAFRRAAWIVRHRDRPTTLCTVLEWAWLWQVIDTETYHAMMQRIYDHPAYTCGEHLWPADDRESRAGFCEGEANGHTFADR